MRRHSACHEEAPAYVDVQDALPFVDVDFTNTNDPVRYASAVEKSAETAKRFDGALNSHLATFLVSDVARDIACGGNSSSCLN